MKVGEFELEIADDREHEKVYAVLSAGDSGCEFYITWEPDGVFRIELPRSSTKNKYALDEFMRAVEIAMVRLRGELA